MEPIKIHQGVIAPLDRSNVDTDAIIPKQFLKKVERTGFGKHLFHEWRYLDFEGVQENPDFVLNKPEFRHATILLTRDNFGCGSSREHAPWAIRDFGFKVIIAPSFADIFYNNCVKNGILLVRLKPSEIEKLFQETALEPGMRGTVNLENQIIETHKYKSLHFELDGFTKECLLKGLDQIGWTLQFEHLIRDYEQRLKEKRPWLN